MTDTTDRENLELAAKAAGYWNYTYNCYEGKMSWNPRDDDGDAFRLAVDLKIELMVTDQCANACFNMVVYSEPLTTGDTYAATRRAIVRVAAAIGRGMKND